MIDARIPHDRGWARSHPRQNRAKSSTSSRDCTGRASARRHLSDTPHDRVSRATLAVETRALLQQLRQPADERSGAPAEHGTLPWNSDDARMQKLREIARRALSSGWSHPGTPSTISSPCSSEQAPSTLPVPSRPRPKDRHTVLHVQSLMDDIVIVKVVTKAHGEPGDPEMLRLPIGIFPTRPRPGERVEIALQLQRSPASSPTGLEGDVPSLLDRAYADLDALLVRRHTQGPAPELGDQIDAAWERLRELQGAARAEIRQQLDDSVELSPSKLKQLIEAARAIRTSEDS